MKNWLTFSQRVSELENAVTDLVRDNKALHQRIDTIARTPGPRGQQGEPGRDGAPGRDGVGVPGPPGRDGGLGQPGASVRGDKGDRGERGSAGPDTAEAIASANAAVTALRSEVAGLNVLLQGLLSREKNTGAYIEFLKQRAAARKEK